MFPRRKRAKNGEAAAFATVPFSVFSESAAELSQQREKQKSKITKKAMQASFLGSVIDAYDFDW